MRKLQTYDNLKTEYCIKKDINIIRFKYDDSITYIEDVIKSI